jgi:hypothetical protein
VIASPATKALRSAIAAKTPAAFLAALWQMREHFPETPFSQRAVILRVVWLITDLALHNEYKYGIQTVLDDNAEHELGAFVPEASDWLSRVGADVAAAYLAEAVALFPKGVVAESPVERMWQIEKITKRSPKAFDRLDRKFQGWTTNLRIPLQNYLKAHEKQIHRMLVHKVRKPKRATLTDVRAILAIGDPWEAIDEFLATIDVTRHARTTSATPDAFEQMMRGFYNIGLYLGSGDGLWKYLEGDPHVSEMRKAEDEWFGVIGASKAAAYFREYRAVFPDGVIPEDRDKRYEILDRADDQLRRIDAAHKTAVRDMMRRAHAYLSANPKLVRAALGLSSSRPRATLKKAAKK